MPGPRLGSSRLVTVTGTIGEARAERRRLVAGDRRPARSGSQPIAVPAESLDRLRRPLPARQERGPGPSHGLHHRGVIPAAGAMSRALGHLPLALTRERIEVWLAELIVAASSRRMVTRLSRPSG